MNPEETQNTSLISNNETNVANEVSSDAYEVSEEELVASNENESDRGNPSDGSAQPSASTRQSPSGAFDDEASRLHCVCNRGNNAFAYGRTDRCPFCVYNAKTCQSGETSGRVSDEESVTFSATNLEALHLTLARGMESVPQTHETSREVQAASTTNSANVDISAPSPVIKSGNAPAEGFSDSSVPYPCQPRQVTLYVIRNDHQLLDVMTFSVYCVEQSMQGRVASIVRQLQRDQFSSIQVVPFGNEYSPQQENRYFHLLNLENEITITFELWREAQRSFRLQEEQRPFQVPLVHIMSLSQNRIPSPLVQVHVEPLCEPGELCQDHLRMTLAYGRTTQRMLIPIWSARPPEST